MGIGKLGLLRVGMKNWRSEIGANVKAFRYAFLPGAEANELGEATDVLLLAIADLRKEAFFAGYLSGARDAVMDAGLDVDPYLNRGGAENRYQELLREEE